MLFSPSSWSPLNALFKASSLLFCSTDTQLETAESSDEGESTWQHTQTFCCLHLTLGFIFSLEMIGSVIWGRRQSKWATYRQPEECNLAAYVKTDQNSSSLLGSSSLDTWAGWVLLEGGLPKSQQVGISSASRISVVFISTQQTHWYERLRLMDLPMGWYHIWNNPAPYSKPPASLYSLFIDASLTCKSRAVDWPLGTNVLPIYTYVCKTKHAWLSALTCYPHADAQWTRELQNKSIWIFFEWLTNCQYWSIWWNFNWF